MDYEHYATDDNDMDDGFGLDDDDEDDDSEPTLMDKHLAKPQAASERYMDPVPAVRPPEDDLLGDDDDDDFNPRMADGDAI